ncbi:MAG TPA: HepT-like ribonuclease domain-containing protein [Gemmatimonadaceae bacterium]
MLCIERIEEYTAIGETALESQLLLDAIERNLEKLADTAGRLSEERRNATSHIAWRDVTDFRNVLAHQYHGIDDEIVWSVIVNDLPPLKAFARAMLAQIED